MRFSSLKTPDSLLTLGSPIRSLIALGAFCFCVEYGGIEYKEDVLEQTSKGTYSFQGVAYDPSNEALNFDDLTSELDSTFGFVERSGGSYKRKLPREIYASLTHSFNQRHHLSATYHMRSWNTNDYHDMGFSYQAKLGKAFHFVAGYNMINGIWNNISGGFALNIGGFQWHLMSDDVYGLIVPGKTSTISIRTGFSFRFGRDRIKDRKYSHPPILSPGRRSGGGDPTNR